MASGVVQVELLRCALFPINPKTAFSKGSFLAQRLMDGLHALGKSEYYVSLDEGRLLHMQVHQGLLHKAMYELCRSGHLSPQAKLQHDLDNSGNIEPAIVPLHHYQCKVRGLQTKCFHLMTRGLGTAMLKVDLHCIPVWNHTFPIKLLHDHMQPLHALQRILQTVCLPVTLHCRLEPCLILRAGLGPWPGRLSLLLSELWAPGPPRALLRPTTPPRVGVCQASFS
mmetsp:Transcript_37075/g.73396  ORF Transcript_37075/g.73396 Transcript_37075/m.73396 type:complete len:225 (-) Transcript_37075:204-878(-)